MILQLLHEEGDQVLRGGLQQRGAGPHHLGREEAQAGHQEAGRGQGEHFITSSVEL